MESRSPQISWGSCGHRRGAGQGPHGTVDGGGGRGVGQHTHVELGCIHHIVQSIGPTVRTDLEYSYDPPRTMYQSFRR